MTDLHPLISRQQAAAVARCVEHNIPFALYAMPGEGEMHFHASLPSEYEHRNDKEIASGAVIIGMFDPASSYLAVINPELSASQVLALDLKTLPEYPGGDIYPTLTDLSKAGYIATVHEIIRDIKRRRAQKVVFSRTIAGRSRRPVADIAADFFDKFPETFRILFFTQETGLWLTATPELLASFEKPDCITTMALAGTRRAGTGTPWDEKNRSEQAYVLDHVTIAAVHSGLADIDTEIDTMAYGDIEHICATISGHGSIGVFANLARELHPTPAVCGTPRDKALELIAKYEAHDRACYAGTISVCTSNLDRVSTYVNLRCALLRPYTPGKDADYEYNIYVGGGITADSDPYSEWEETCLKARPLLQALQGHDNPDDELSDDSSTPHSLQEPTTVKK